MQQPASAPTSQHRAPVHHMCTSNGVALRSSAPCFPLPMYFYYLNMPHCLQLISAVSFLPHAPPSPGCCVRLLGINTYQLCRPQRGTCSHPASPRATRIPRSLLHSPWASSPGPQKYIIKKRTNLLPCGPGRRGACEATRTRPDCPAVIASTPFLAASRYHPAPPAQCAPGVCAAHPQALRGHACRPRAQLHRLAGAARHGRVRAGLRGALPGRHPGHERAGRGVPTSLRGVLVRRATD